MLLASIGGGVALSLLQPAPNDEVFNLTRALEALDRGDYFEARRIASAIPKESGNEFRDTAGPLFVLGTALAYEGRTHFPESERVSLLRVAIRFLEESEVRGFPLGREREGYLALAESLQGIGQYAASLPYLIRALSHAQENEVKIHALLAEAYTLQYPIDADSAVKHARVCLKSNNLSPLESQMAQLALTRAMLANGNYDEALSLARQIPKSSVHTLEARSLEGRILLAKGDLLAKTGGAALPPEATLAYSQARDVLLEAATSDGQTGRHARAVQYLLGVANEHLGELPAAEAQFARTRRTFAGAPEGNAAAIKEAELLSRRGDDRTAVSLLVETMHSASDTEEFALPWLNHEALLANVGAYYNRLLEKHEYGLAVDLASAPPRVISASQLSNWRASARRQEAEHFKRSLSSLPALIAEAREHELRAKMRIVGKEFERLAQEHATTREFPMDLWNSASAYFEGRDYKSAERMLIAFLATNDVPKKVRAEGMIAEAQFAQGATGKAWERVQEIIRENPTHPDSYSVRILGAKVAMELNQFGDAKTLLEENLFQQTLSPRSSEWRDSIFLLGRLHFQSGLSHEAAASKRTSPQNDVPSRERIAESQAAFNSFHEAIDTFEKAIDRFPQDTRNVEARFLLAESHRHAARWPRQRLALETIESTRATRAREIQSELTAAIGHYDLVISKLSGEHEGASLSGFEQAVLRNSYFAKADSLFDLQRWDEAIKAYSAATSRYQNEPIALEAYVQLAACHRRLSRKAEAAGTLEQAKIVLSRLPDDADFRATTRNSKAEWRTWIDWLAAL